MSTPDTPDAPAPASEEKAPEEGGPEEAAPEGAEGTRTAPPEHVPAVSAEELVDGEVGVEEPEVEERRYPSTIGGAFYLLVLAVVAVGLVLAGLGQWRGGIRVFAGALLFAALVRLLLKPYDAGMLAVRNKTVDAGILAVLGAVMIVLAQTIPDQI